MESPDWSQYEAVVEKRWAYYRPRFESFAQGGWLSWNWAAFFGTLAWLRYRRLQAWSWAYFFVSAPMLCAAGLVATSDACATALEPPSAVMVVLGIGVLGCVVPALLADRIYFVRVRSLVQAAQNDGAKGGVGGYKGALLVQSGLVLLVVIALPSYGNYRHRAMVSEGIGMASAAKTPLAEYLADKGRIPARIEDLAVPTTGRYVGSVSLAPDGTVRATFGDQVRSLAGRSVAIVPVLRDGRIAEWTCRSEDLPAVCLPAACRR